MKIVSLARPEVIDGAVRYPVEGALVVSDDIAKALKDAKALTGDPEDLPSPEAPAEPKAPTPKKEA